MARANERIAIGAALLAALLVAIPADAGQTRTARPLDGAQRREIARQFTSRPFPHLLHKGEIGQVGDRSNRRGNARWEAALAAPTVCRSQPRLLSDHGRDPAEALRNLRALRQEAAPETVRIVAIRVDFLKDSPIWRIDRGWALRSAPAEEAKIPVDPPRRITGSTSRGSSRRSDDTTIFRPTALVLEYDVYPQEPDSAYHLSDTGRYGPWIFSVSSDSIYARAGAVRPRKPEVAADTMRGSGGSATRASSSFTREPTSRATSARTRATTSRASISVFGDSAARGRPGGEDSVSQSRDGRARNGVARRFPRRVQRGDGPRVRPSARVLRHLRIFAGLPVAGLFSLMDSGDSHIRRDRQPIRRRGSSLFAGCSPRASIPFHRIVFPFFRLADP